MKEHISKNKVWQIIGVSVLCAVLVLGAVLGVVFGMHHSTEDLNVSKDMSSDDIVVSATEENGIMLTSGVATTAADGTTTKELTATVTPSNSSSLTYSWSVAFKDASSEWATGKNVTDYVTVSQNSSDKFKATVTFKKRFSEQIIVSISCDFKPDVKASATVDCYKELKSFGFCFTSDLPSNNVKVSYTFDEMDFGRYDGNANGYFVDDDYDVTYTTEYGEGTIEPDVKLYFGIHDKSLEFVCTDVVSLRDIVAQESDLSSGTRISLILKYNGNVMSEISAELVLLPTNLALDNTAIVF